MIDLISGNIQNIKKNKSTQTQKQSDQKIGRGLEYTFLPTRHTDSQQTNDSFLTEIFLTLQNDSTLVLKEVLV